MSLKEPYTWSVRARKSSILLALPSAFLQSSISFFVDALSSFDGRYSSKHAKTSSTISPISVSGSQLKLIPILKKKFKCKVGYSGHEIGATNVSVPAVMMGASSIERHVTVSRTNYGYDQAASLEKEGLRKLVRDIRILDKIMGDGKKKIWASEKPNIKKLRQILT